MVRHGLLSFLKVNLRAPKNLSHMVFSMRLYRGRADCEKRIKELKYDFGVNTFNLPVKFTPIFPS